MYVFGMVEMEFCYLQLGFLYANAGWYMFGRVCYVDFYQRDDVTFYFVASILSRIA